MLYKLSRAVNRASLTVPPEMAAVIPPNARFQPELVNEGVLFRIHLEAQDAGLPEWAQSQVPAE